MQLSVIIPVFRVEATLRRCVESVLAGLPAESEVVLVDDGSDDRCPALCDEWAGRAQAQRRAVGCAKLGHRSGPGHVAHVCR